jgi:hypothetical protein
VQVARRHKTIGDTAQSNREVHKRASRQGTIFFGGRGGGTVWFTLMNATHAVVKFYILQCILLSPATLYGICIISYNLIFNIWCERQN